MTRSEDCINTFILYYKMYENKVEAIDYIDWTIAMLKSGYSSDSLLILSSLQEPLNLFEVEDYFKRSVKELNIYKPSYEECARSFIVHLSEMILAGGNNMVEVANEIYSVVRSLEYPEDLIEWYKITEWMDDFRYGDNISNISEQTLTEMIIKIAKNQIGRYVSK
ncbi:hypothetical protein [Niallia sp. 01092]|uniref:hypothetical protein n=1 Tax=unclassified Niallia TaxID=2837522 RepID=UPI003FD03EC9